MAHGTCKFVKSKIVGSLTNFSVVSLDEDQIATNLVKNGPFVGSYLFSVNKRTCSTYLYPTPQRNYRYIYLIAGVHSWPRHPQKLPRHIRQLLTFLSPMGLWLSPTLPVEKYLIGWRLRHFQDAQLSRETCPNTLTLSR